MIYSYLFVRRFLTILYRFLVPFAATVLAVSGTVVFDAVQAEESALSESTDALLHAVVLSGESVTFTAPGADGFAITNSLADTPLPDAPFTLTTGENTQVALTVGGRVAVRVDANSLVQINQVVMADDGTPHVVVELSQGQIYATTAIAGGMVDLYVNSVLVMPYFGSVTVTYLTPDTSFSVASVAHSAHIAFLRPDWRQFINNSQEPLFLNLFTLSEGYQSTIDPSKITDRISSLRTSKLVKEFPVLPITALDDPWLTLNTGLDYAAVQSFQKDLIAHSGTVALADWYTQSFDTLHTVLADFTVMPDKIAVLKTASLREAYGALFAAAEDRDTEGVIIAASAFATAVSQADPVFVDPFLRALKADFFSILPSSSLYGVKSALYAVDQDQFSVPAAMLRDTESLLTLQDETSAHTVYNDFIPLVSIVLQGSTSFDDQQTYLLFALKTSLDGLFYRYAVMQSEENYAPVAVLEDVLINTISNPVESAERRQTFVATRLQLLKRLLYLGKNKVVNIADVTSFGSYLLDTTEDLYVAGATSVAVNTYFAQELSSASDWLRFFQSPEFAGMTDEDDVQSVFQIFLEKEASQAQLLSYVQTGVSAADTDSALSSDDALAEATDLLHAARIDFKNLIPLNDAENRLFSIEGGLVKGVAFTADYDRITDLLYNLSIQGTSYTTGVLRENLGDFVAALIAGETFSYTSVEPIETVTEHSILERVAIQVVLDAFEMVDIVATDSHVVIIDLEKQQFTVERVQFRDSDAVFSFDYSASDKQITNLSIQTLLGLQKIDGSYGLDELENLVETTYNAASSALFGS